MMTVNIETSLPSSSPSCQLLPPPRGPPTAPHRPPPPSSYFLTRSKEGNFIGRMRKLMIPDIMTSSAEAGRINQSLMTN